MYRDSLDMFAEMDELFDHLFSRVSGNFGMREMEFSSPDTSPADFTEEPADEPVQAEIEEGQFRERFPKCSRTRTGQKLSWNFPVSPRIT